MVVNAVIGYFLGEFGIFFNHSGRGDEPRIRIFWLEIAARSKPKGRPRTDVRIVRLFAGRVDRHLFGQNFLK